MKCPPFTNSQRHDEDISIYDEETGENKISETAATMCELDTEFHVR